MSQLTEFRQQIDQFIRHHPQSPLLESQRQDFQGLAYYEANPHLIFELEATRFPENEPLITMQTSTGDEQLYQRWGQLTFTVQAEEVTLTIYANPQQGDFFLPFKDKTNGEETYGAGRYLDNHRPGLQPLEGDRFVLDFNYAYNPYCAYSEYFSCPLPPRENWLTVPIEAGEKKFK